MLRALAALALTASAALAAPVPKSVKAKGPAVDGRWEAVLLKSSGNDFTKSRPWVWVIEGEAVTRYHPQADGTLQLDGPATLARPEDARPDEFDYHLPSGGQSVLFRARVEVKGDELVINFAEVNDPRPADMTELTRGYFYRFKRVKEK